MGFPTIIISFFTVLVVSIIICLCYRKYFLHIKHQDYYDDGNLKRVYFTVNGILDGIESIYYPTGELNKTKTWLNGVLEGPFVVFFRNGMPYIEGNYANGTYKGVYSVYDLNGQTIMQKEY